MKKIFLTLAVLAALIFSVAPSHALLSMPDAVPGKNILLPFFLSKITSGESTLLVIQNVTSGARTLSIDVCDIDSVVQIDTSDTLTKYDVESWNIRDDWIAIGSSGAQNALKIDLDGDGTVDHYAGYVTLTEASDENSLVGYVYQIDLARGIASGVLAVSEEYDAAPIASTTSGNIEIFSAGALAAAKDALGTGVDPVNTFSMYPRYFVYNANSENYLFSWRNTGTDRTYHVNFYDEAEVPISGNISLLHELDILDVRDIVPAGHMTSYPYAGWIDFEVSNANEVTVAGTGFSTAHEWIMYNYQKAVAASAASNWNVLFDVHRDIGS